MYAAAIVARRTERVAATVARGVMREHFAVEDEATRRETDAAMRPKITRLATARFQLGCSLQSFDGEAQLIFCAGQNGWH